MGEEVSALTTQAIFGGTLAITDGAWGTEFQRRGLPPHTRSELWNVERPEVVIEVAASYVGAGSQVILTNTFGANRFVLERHGLAERAAELSEAGARLSCEAAGTRALVFGSIGPSGRLLMMGNVTSEGLYDAFREQAVALARGGVAAIVIETMSALDELTTAVRAVRENTSLPVVACMTYDSGKNCDRTMMGVTPAQAVAALAPLGVAAVGANCGVGIERYVEVCRQLRQATPAPLWIKPNAGMPELDGDRTVYRQSPDDFAAYLDPLIEAGATMGGGCCGTNPDFIRALVRRRGPAC